MLDKLQVDVRPRSPWEAIELGFPLVRTWYRPIYLTWLVVTLPFFCILFFVLGPGIALLVFWWFKPLFDRFCLYIISKATFGNVPDLMESLSFGKNIFSSQLFASLLWMRFFDWGRSFTLPVRQLEGIKGKVRRKRIDQLKQRGYSGVAGWMTCGYMHLEIVLYLAPAFFIYSNFEASFIGSDWTLAGYFYDFWMLFLEDEAPYAWLAAICYYLAVSIIEPLYVASGFSLYLNRRSQLESWHVEVVFRHLMNRNEKSSLVPKERVTEQ